MIAICEKCNVEFEAQRRTRRFCSDSCRRNALWKTIKERICPVCGNAFLVKSRLDANRKYCSQKCSKKAYAKRVLSWKKDHPDKSEEYRDNAVSKNPSIWREKHLRERLEALSLLGGKCVVCGADNQNWLHIDFIPTTRGKSYRHPRHIGFIRDNLSLFRILCANHHYELTLTGSIEGTDITQ